MGTANSKDKCSLIFFDSIHRRNSYRAEVALPSHQNNSQYAFQRSAKLAFTFHLRPQELNLNCLLVRAELCLSIYNTVIDQFLGKILSPEPFTGVYSEPSLSSSSSSSQPSGQDNCTSKLAELANPS